MPPAGWRKSSSKKRRFVRGWNKTPAKCECLFCGKVVRNYFGLEGHINSHIGERPWECSHCDATFLSYQTLIVHRNNIHYGKKFKCNICARVFRVPSNLYSHRKKDHSYKPGRKNNGRTFKTFVVYSSSVSRRRLMSGGANHIRTKRKRRGRTKKTTVPICLEDTIRQAVEIESNPGTPTMTVNVLSRDAPVVTKLKAPVIRIHRLPDGIWKQQTVNNYSSNNPESQSETESDDDEKDETESEPQNPESLFAKNDNVGSSQLQPATDPTPLLVAQSALLPHQMTPLPPFNLAFPPFPFKLHNFTVPDNAHYSGLNHPQQQQQQQQQRWDPSFFLHLNRYNPEDSCYHADYPPKRTASLPATNPIRSTQNKKKYVSKASSLTKAKRKQRPAPVKKKKCSETGALPATTTSSPTRLSMAEKEELMQETEGGVSCKECGKTFQIKWNLVAHLMTHTGEKPFACHFCKMRFRQKAHMIKHIASLHRFQDEKGKGKEDFSCGFCGQHCFEVKLDLIKHIRDVHNEMLLEEA